MKDLKEAVTNLDHTKAVKDAADEEDRRANTELRMAKDRCRRTQRERVHAGVAFERAQAALLHVARQASDSDEPAGSFFKDPGTPGLFRD